MAGTSSGRQVIVQELLLSIAELSLRIAELLLSIAELLLCMAELSLRGAERCVLSADAKFRCDSGRSALRSERCAG